VRGELQKSKKQISVRGLNRDCNHDLKNQECSDHCFRQTGSVPGILRSLGSQGHATRDGTPDLGEKDCHDRSDRMEERSELRRQISEATNSLSVSERVRSISGYFSGGGCQILEGVQQPNTWRGSSEQILLRQVGCEARKSPAVGGVFFLDFLFIEHS